jgi:Holliday junction DNA helicase RuvA
MIAGVRGNIRRVEAAGLVISIGPLDLRVSTPAPTILEARAGEEIALRTHLYVREDQLSLYGFASDAELEIFELLLSVSGVGPKAALGVLSALSPIEFRRAVQQEDARALTRAPGVGLRAATRIIVDLKGKVEAVEAEMIPVGGTPDLHSDAIAALVALGYSATEARRAVESAPHGESVEETLRGALTVLAEHA